jgi:flagellar secretion chaperone FliS
MNLTQSDIAGLYSQETAQGATPLGLVVALYDTILRDLRRANEAIARNDIAKRTFEMNHALRVIAELENVLDFERGGKAAKQLKNFYAVTRGMILDAGIRNSQQMVNQLIEIFGTMRQAWHEAEKKVNGTTTAAVAVGQSAQAGNGATTRFQNTESAEPRRGNWSA